MAKKSFGVSKTIAVQPKQLSPDEVEQAIQQIHQSEPEDTKPIKTVVEAKQPVQEPMPEPKPAKVKTAAERVKKKKTPGRRVRLSVDVTPETHKKLKIRAIERDSDIMRYVEMLIERDLAKK